MADENEYTTPPFISDPADRGDGNDGDKQDVFQFTELETIVSCAATYVFVPIIIHDGNTLEEKNKIFKSIEFSAECTTEFEDEGEAYKHTCYVKTGHKVVSGTEVSFITETAEGEETNSYIGGEGGVYVSIHKNETQTLLTFTLTATLGEITREYTFQQRAVRYGLCETYNAVRDTYENEVCAVDSGYFPLRTNATDANRTDVCITNRTYTYALLDNIVAGSDGELSRDVSITNKYVIAKQTMVGSVALILRGVGGGMGYYSTNPAVIINNPTICVYSGDIDEVAATSWRDASVVSLDNLFFASFSKSASATTVACDYEKLAFRGRSRLSVFVRFALGSYTEGNESEEEEIDNKATKYKNAFSPQDGRFIKVDASTESEPNKFAVYSIDRVEVVGDGDRELAGVVVSAYFTDSSTFRRLTGFLAYPLFFSDYDEDVTDYGLFQTSFDSASSLDKDGESRTICYQVYRGGATGDKNPYRRSSITTLDDNNEVVSTEVVSPVCISARIPYAQEWVNQTLSYKATDNTRGDYYTRIYFSNEYNPPVVQACVSYKETTDYLTDYETGEALDGQDTVGYAPRLRSVMSSLYVVEPEDDNDGDKTFKVSVTPETVSSGQDGETLTCVFRADFTGYAWADVEIGDEVAENYPWLSFTQNEKKSEEYKEWTGVIAANELTTKRVALLRGYVQWTDVEDVAVLTQNGFEAFEFDVEPKEIYDETGDGGVFELTVTKTANTGDVLFRDEKGDDERGEFFTQRYNKTDDTTGKVLVSLGENTGITELSGSFTVYENNKDLNCSVTVKQAVRKLKAPSLRIEPWRLLDPGYAVLFYAKNDVCTIDIYDATSRTLVATLESDYPATKSSINAIRCRTVNDVMYVVHPDRIPRKILRKDNEDGTGYVFSIEDCEFEIAPTLDEEVDSETTFTVETKATAATAQIGDLCTQGSTGTIFCSGISAVLANTPTVQDVSESIVIHNLSLSDAQVQFVFNVETSPNISIGDFITGIDACKLSFSLGFKFRLDVGLDTGEASYKYRLEKILQNTKLVVKSFTESTITTEAASLSIPWSRTYSSLFKREPRAWDFEITDEAFVDTSNDENSPSLDTTSVTSTYPDGIFRRIQNGSDDTDNSVYFEVANAYGSELIIRESSSVGSDDESESTTDGLFFKAEDTWRVGQTFYLRPKQDAVTYSGALCFSDVAVDFAGNLGETPTPNKPIVVQDDTGGAQFATPWLPAVGKITLKTAGKWAGTLVVEERQKDGEIVELFRVSGLNGMNNEERTRDIVSRGSDVRVRVASRARAQTRVYSFKGENNDELFYSTVGVDTGCYWQLDVDVSTEIYFKITAVFDGYAYAKCLSSLGICFKTDNWAEGAWSSKYGYPRTVAIFQERMVFGGNYKKPTTLWLSKTNDWTDFEKGVDDTSPITATAIVDGFDEIYWIEVTRNSLIIGTAWREWFFGNSNGSGIVTPATYSFISISNYGGTSGVDGVIFGGQLVAAKAGGEELRAIDYNAMTEETGGEAISLFAEHLFKKNPIKRIAVTVAPETRLWALTTDGRIMCLTYDNAHGVFAFGQHTFFTGVIDLVAVRRGEQDIVVMVTQKGGKFLLGELDPNSDVYTDDGENYESILEPTPIVSDNYSGGVYGHRTNFVGADIYVDEGERFYCKLYGGEETRVDLGFNSQNKLTAFDREKKIELNANSSWCDEAGLVIRTNHPAPLSITAIGARVKHA